MTHDFQARFYAVRSDAGKGEEVFKIDNLL